MTFVFAAFCMSMIPAVLLLMLALAADEDSPIFSQEPLVDRGHLSS